MRNFEQDYSYLSMKETGGTKSGDCGGWSHTAICLCPRHCVIENVWEGKVQNLFAWAKIWFFSFSMRFERCETWKYKLNASGTDTRDYRVFGLCTSSCILKNTCYTPS
jgi:hypothetical protein